MTSLIDVIFLLLLFFMLSSTFSRYGEIALVGAGSGGAASAEPPRFLQLGPDEARLNGKALALADLPGALGAGGGTLIVALQPDVTAQRLTDVLALLRAIPGLSVSVLE